MHPQIPKAYRYPASAEESLYEAFGDDISQPTPPHWIRLGFQNINGIDRGTRPATEVIHAMKTLHIDIYGCAETNCNWTSDFKAAVTAAMAYEFGSSNVTAASSMSTKQGYLPGGVVTASVGGITKRITDQGSDKLGRFSWITLKGQNATGLSIITAYRVSQKKSEKSGQQTSHYQQKAAMYKEGELTPDPRNRILQDLTTLITSKRIEGNEIILSIDANESWEMPKSMLHNFMITNNLADIHYHKIPVLPITTWDGSTQRIDYMMATPGAMASTKQAGICSLHEGIISDHILLYADIDINEIIGGSIPS